ncbi:MAG: mannose-1-phosphate guanylyltransferase [Pelolinea sp.]|nr:mannose-1-phosphate guanylyltransferase [Pelolinea sp.]
MNTHYYAVIMAGGGGTRLWPLSRKGSPKQLLKIINKKSLFRIAIDRLDGLFDFDHIFVVTIKDQLAKLREEAPEIPLKNYLIEPMPKGTASVVGLAATYLQKIDPQAVMAILTADHIIENIPLFQELLTQAKAVALNKYLVTLGINPTFPATGYGYIEAGERIIGQDSFHVKNFKEKPNLETANEYIKSNTYYWNSGMFIWEVGTILDEFKKQMPVLYEKLTRIRTRINQNKLFGEIIDIWETIEPQTIDYGIMEGASSTAVLPAHDLGWKDVGSWDSLYSILKSDQNGIIQLVDQMVNVESKDILVQSTDENKLIAVIGLEDIVIVDHENTLLICKKGETEKVRQVIEILKEKGLNKYL